MTVTITLLDPHFNPREDHEEAREDQCLHGSVRVCADDAVLIDSGPDDLTLTAAGIHLLRTLESDHHPGDEDDDVTDLVPIFPCCGFTVYRGESRAEISGCPNGEDLEVITRAERVHLRTQNHAATVGRQEWREAVLAFTQAVEEVYRAHPQRAPLDASDETTAGWPQLWEEWRAARTRALAL